jgi:hypothetical protein
MYIQKLSRFPDTSYKIITEIYENDLKGKDPTGRYSENHYFVTLDETKLAIINATLPSPASRIDLYVLVGNISIHIDRGRMSVLQMPMMGCADGNTHTVSVKEGCEDKVTEIPPKNPIHYIDGGPSPRYFLYDEDLYDTYKSDVPYLQNITVPHGGRCEDPENPVIRHLLSFSYYKPYAEMVSLFKDWI